MKKNYLTYPFKTMRITQSYDGTTSHKPHTTGSPKDFPIDEGGKDSGRDAYLCPCDEVKVVRVYGVGNGGINTLWIESTSKVVFADGTEYIFCSQITHSNDSDFKNIKVGKKFKRGEVICHEGTDGASRNHIHHSVGKGHITNNGWKKNSNGKYVLTCTGGTVKPENAFFLADDTVVKSDKGLKFKKIPKTTVYEVTADVLNIRSGAGVSCGKVGSYKKGTQVEIVETKAGWGKTDKGWVSLDYCKKI